MRGFLSLEPDAETLARLLSFQNRLSGAVHRQGVHLSERLSPVLLNWPFATLEELDQASALLDSVVPTIQAGMLAGHPSADRPAEIGLPLEGLDEFQATLFQRLKQTLDPDPPKQAFVRLARVSPASRKVGIALKGSGLLIEGEGAFGTDAFEIWHQAPDGFRLWRRIPFL